MVMGKTFSNQGSVALNNVTTIIGASGNGKSTLADAFGFLADCLDLGVEVACDEKNRGGFDQIRSQGVKEPICFELYYRETSNTKPITYELHIDIDVSGRPYVKEERLRQRVQKRGRPLSFLHIQNGKGYAYEGKEGGEDDEGRIIVSGKKTEVELSDIRKLGIVTLGAMKQYERIERFLNFLKSWYLCYFSPDAARIIQTAAPQPYLNRTGSNINVKEMEAWLLGDQNAIRAAYPDAKFKMAKTYGQDAICDTWQVLADVVYNKGYTGLMKTAKNKYSEIGRVKCEWADKIGARLDLENNESPSFNFFIKEITYRIEA